MHDCAMVSGLLAVEYLVEKTMVASLEDGVSGLLTVCHHHHYYSDHAHKIVSTASKIPIS